MHDQSPHVIKMMLSNLACVSIIPLAHANHKPIIFVDEKLLCFRVTILMHLMEIRLLLYTVQCKYYLALSCYMLDTIHILYKNWLTELCHFSFQV